MIKKTVLLFLLFFSLTNTSFADTKIAPDGGFSGVVDKVYDGVVNIITSQKVKGRGYDENVFKDFEDLLEKFFNIEPRNKGGGAPSEEKKVNALGSGFIIDEKGIIVTNYHLVEGASEISIKFNDESTEGAKIIGYDKSTDIAVLKINTKKKLVKIPFGDSSKLKIGDLVLAIGNPFGFGGSVSFGIVSAIARDVNIGPFDEFIQTDAAINRGNSGGPLINMQGEVIGINTLIISNTGSNTGLGFAIPSSVANYIVQRIIKDGYVTRAWMGVLLQPVSDDIAAYYKQSKPKGAIVAEVLKDSPADAAGIKVGDLILEFNGKTIENMRDLPKVVSYTEIGSKVPVKILRKNKEMNLTVTVDKKPEYDNDESQELMINNKEKKNQNSSELLKGVHVQNVSSLTTEMKSMYKIRDNKGVFIAKVDPESKAYKNGLRQGYVIRGANQEEVNNIEDLKGQISLAKKEDGQILLHVFYFIKEYSRFIAIPVK